MLIKIPPGAEFIIDKLTRAGFPAYIVGGCVRDVLMGRVPEDWDITTRAYPEEIIKALRPLKVIPTGLKHGTVTVLYDDASYEVTTFRVDGEYTDGRRPDEVTFTEDLKDDLCRRDFTVNAVAYNKTDGLVDYFGGINDIERKLLRCVGNAAERFAEDYLRMLRAYRFAATLGFSLDAEIIAEVSLNKQKLDLISAERITAELNKILLNGSFEGQAAFLDKLGGVIFPEITNDADAFAEVKSVLCFCEKDLSLRLAALLFRNDTNTTSAVLKRLRYDNKTHDEVVNIIKNFDMTVRFDKLKLKKILNKIGKSATYKLIGLSTAVARAREEDLSRFDTARGLFDEITDRQEPYRIKDLAVSGEDIMSCFELKTGKEIGQILELLLDKVQTNPKLNEKEALIEIARGNINGA